MTRGQKRQALAHYRRFDPFLPVDHRWRSAYELVAEGRRGSPRYDSPEVVEAVRYLRARGRAGDDRARAAVERRWADVDAARRLAEGPDDAALWEVQAWLLTGADDATVAARCGLRPATVSRYESLFFGVRGRFGARDWVERCAVRRGQSPWVTCDNLGGVWRALARHGGPAALEVVLAVTADRPMPGWVAARERAGDADYGERLRLRTKMLVDAMMLPADLDALTLGRLSMEAMGFARERQGTADAASLAARVDVILAESPLRRPGGRGGDTIVVKHAAV
jgi:hypothetical protein